MYQFPLEDDVQDLTINAVQLEGKMTEKDVKFWHSLPDKEDSNIINPGLSDGLKRQTESEKKDRLQQANCWLNRRMTPTPGKLWML